LKKFLDSPGQYTQITASSELSDFSTWEEAATEKAGFSSVVAICFTINYIMGTGFLALPWAFVQGGLISSTIALLLIAVIADISKDFLLETMARAEALESLKNQNENRKNNIIQIKKLEDGKRQIDFETMSPISMMGDIELDQDDDIDTNDTMSNKQFGASDDIFTSRSYGSLTYDQKRALQQKKSTQLLKKQRRYNKATINSLLQKCDNENRLLIVKDRKFEIPELCKMFLGEHVAKLYTALVSFYLYLALWAYTSVFASALAKEIPVFGSSHEGWDYTLYVAVFATIVVPLSCRELNEQVTLQVTLAACRILMVTLMVITVLLFPKDTDASFETKSPNMTVTPATSNDKSLALFNFSGLYHSLPVIAYAFIFHHSIPGLSHPVADKRDLKYIFKSTNVISALWYTFVGLCVGIYYGTGINQSSNLNWKDFHGGTGTMQINLDINGNVVDTIWVDVAWWAKAISLFIVIFPALDVASVFPLCTITLGNNLLDTFVGEESVNKVVSLFLDLNSFSIRTDLNHSQFFKYLIFEKISCDILKKYVNTRVLFRLIACTPPIIGALLIRELGIITDYAGAFGFVIAFTFPAVLYLASKKKIDSVFGTDKSLETYYSGYGSSNIYAVLISLFGFGMGSFVLVCLYQ